MKLLEWTLPAPEANLAADEALLDWCEARAETGCTEEYLRFWVPDRPFVVVGYGQQVEREVDLAACRRLGIPVLRRCSGGGTVLQAPGCLNYTLILRIDPAGPTRSVPTTNRYILERHRTALTALLGRNSPPVQLQGETDLTLGGRKFSGNAQRRRRHCLLFHGTFLLQIHLDLMTAVLKMPSRQPDYRQGRSHADFLTTLPLTAEAVRQALIHIWSAHQTGTPPPADAIAHLIQTRYAQPDWIFRTTAPVPTTPAEIPPAPG